MKFVYCKYRDVSKERKEEITACKYYKGWVDSQYCLYTCPFCGGLEIDRKMTPLAELQNVLRKRAFQERKRREITKKQTPLPKFVPFGAPRTPQW